MHMKKTFQFYKKKISFSFINEIPLQLKRHKKIKKWEFAFKFKLEINKKNKRTKKKVRQKIEIAFNFTKISI